MRVGEGGGGVMFGPFLFIMVLIMMIGMKMMMRGKIDNDNIKD